MGIQRFIRGEPTKSPIEPLLSVLRNANFITWNFTTKRQKPRRNSFVFSVPLWFSPELSGLFNSRSLEDYKPELGSHLFSLCLAFVHLAVCSLSGSAFHLHLLMAKGLKPLLRANQSPIHTVFIVTGKQIGRAHV